MTSPSAEMNDLHAATMKLMSTFSLLVNDQVDKNFLKKGNLLNFLTSDYCKELIENPVDGFVVSRILRDLQDDEDGEVDFHDFMLTVAAVTFCSNPKFKAYLERNGRAHERCYFPA